MADANSSSSEEPLGDLETDFKVLDRYQSFSAEVLRLSLAAFAAVGLVLNIDRKNAVGSEAALALLQGGSKKILIEALALFAAASFFAIAHRYVSTVSVEELVKLARRRGNRKELKFYFLLSDITILLAPAFLGTGVLVFGVAIVLAIS